MSGSNDGIDGTGAAARFSNPTDVTADGTGNLYVADASNNTIRKVVVATGVVTTLAGTAALAGSSDGTGAAARFYNPSGVMVDGAGNLYVTDSSVTTLVGIPQQRGVAPGPLPARLAIPVGLAVLPTGDLFITDEAAVLMVH